MRIFRTIILFGLSLTASMAFGQSIKSSYDKDYHLSSLKTYEYKADPRDASDPLAADTLTEQKIKDALEDALAVNYLHQAYGGSTPDFIIAYHISTRDVTESRRVPLRGPLGPRGNLQIENYIQGTLTLDFIDPQTKKLIWRGVASGMVGKETVDFQITEEKIKAATRLLLEQFRKDTSGF